MPDARPHDPVAHGPVTHGPVTLVVVNARVWTGTPRRPWADAVVVRGDRIALVGGSAEARKLAAGAPGARLVDARGRLLVGGTGDGDPRPLAPGGPADLVLADDSGVVPPADVRRDARVVLAVVGGQIVEGDVPSGSNL